MTAEAPKELSSSNLLDIILTSLEQDGPSCGMGTTAFTPGLLPDWEGLLPTDAGSSQHDLPSILIPSGADNRIPVFDTSTNVARCLYVSHGSPVKRLTWLTSLPG